MIDDHDAFHVAVRRFACTQGVQASVEIGFVVARYDDDESKFRRRGLRDGTGSVAELSQIRVALFGERHAVAFGGEPVQNNLFPGSFCCLNMGRSIACRR